MTNANPDSGPTQPAGAPLPLGAIIGIVVVALVGVAMLVYALMGLFNAPTAAPTASANLPATAGPATSTPALLIPTVTSAPQTAPTDAPTAAPAPSDTPAAAVTDTPAATAAPTGPVVTILLPANVRSGPGVNYPVIGGLQAGATAEAVGRDSSATWYVVNYLGAQGWVSNQVAQFGGDTNALAVIAAPPPPAPTATPVPPTAAPTTAAVATQPPSTGNSFGVRVEYFFLTNNITSVLVGQSFQFKFKIVNTSDQPLYFGGMGAIALPGGPAQPSWEARANPIPPKGELEWEDNMTINKIGDYKIHLGICMLASQPACENPAGWTTLSAGIALAVR